jgi:hypothetical protein
VPSPPAADVDRVLLAGGYRNAVWKVRDGRQWLIEKHYAEDPGKPNPMFPNLPDHEALALETLAGSGCAPELVAYRPATSLDRAAVTYRYVKGGQWGRGVVDVAALLHRVHHHPLGTEVARRLRVLQRSAAEAQRHADDMLAAVPRGASAQSLGVRPASPSSTRIATSTLVHTDCGPGNLVRTRAGVVLIDWQCPGLGDPVEDIACFLSPAMMILYSARPHSARARAAFLDAYDDASVIERYHRDGASWHYRIAAYCAWRAHTLARRQPDVAARYLRALTAELDLIQRWAVRR